MSKQKSWQEEAAEEAARRALDQHERMEIEAEWKRSGKPTGLQMCFRLEEILSYASVGQERCRSCGALLYLIENPEGLGVRGYDLAGTRHYCEPQERARRKGE